MLSDSNVYVCSFFAAFLQSDFAVMSNAFYPLCPLFRLRFALLSYDMYD